MADLNKMDLFAGSRHEGDLDLDTLPPVKENSSESELLDYVVLVFSRIMSSSVAFKGGYMLNQLLQGNSRALYDDSLLIDEQDNYEEVKSIIKSICDKFVEEGYIASYKIKDTIEEYSSGGVDMYDETGRKILGIDVGLHNRCFGIGHYSLDFIGIEDFEVEHMLADKLITIMKKPLKRIKDLYDFYAITNFFAVDIEKLAKYIELQVVDKWGHMSFDDEIIVQYKRAWNKLKLTSYTDWSLEKPDFDTALGRFHDLVVRLRDSFTVKTGMGGFKCKDRFDKEFKNHSYVLANFTALARAGLILFNTTHLCLQTDKSELDKMRFAYFTYYYNESIDYTYELTPSLQNPLILQPSKERALVECILHLDWVDEGLLIEGLKTYLDQFYNESKLLEVARHFNLDESVLRHWIKEAEEDCEV